jgi:hypothetical protein
MKKIFYLALILFTLGNYFTHKHHVSFWFDEIKGFDAMFGAFSCGVIIWFSKSIFQPSVMRKEDYYE